MSIKAKTKTNHVLAIITLVFAILAAATLGLAAVWDLFTAGADIILDLLFSILFNLKGSGSVHLPGAAWLSIISLAFRLITPLIYTVILVAAAVLLIVNRRGSLSFIPMGLLAGMTFASPISLVVALIGNNVLARYFGIDALVVFSYLGEIPAYVASMAVAAVFAGIFFLLAATLLKKLRPIPMAIISVVLGAGLVVRVVIMILSFSVQFNELVLYGYMEATYLYNVVTSLIVSISGCFAQLLVCVASFFAILAVIPYKNKVAVDVGAGLASVAGTVAKTLSSDNADVVASEEVSADSADVAAPDEADDETVARLNDPAEDKDAEEE